MDKKFAAKAPTLTDADISSQRHVSRRSLLSALGLGLGVAAAAVGGRPATTAAQGNCTDNDGGRYADLPGFGRRCGPGTPRPTGCTDMDSGPNEDAPGFGRRCSNWI